jgi:hypothetical protein
MDSSTIQAARMAKPSPKIRAINTINSNISLASQFSVK